MLSPARLEALSTALASRGFHICTPFDTSVYNNCVVDCSNAGRLSRLPHNRLGVLVGNTKTMWPHFTSHLQEMNDASMATIPTSTHYLTEGVLDRFAMESIRACCDSLSMDGVMLDIMWAHHTSPDRLIAIQRLSHVIGCAYLDEDIHLNVHHVYGPWIAFRAVLVFDVEPESLLASNDISFDFQNVIKENPCASHGCDITSRAMMQIAIANLQHADAHRETHVSTTEIQINAQDTHVSSANDSSTDTVQLSDEVSDELVEAGTSRESEEEILTQKEDKKVLGNVGTSAESEGKGSTVTGSVSNACAHVREHWRDWLAVRDVCCVGKGYRYSDEQIRYHYTKDISPLLDQLRSTE